MYGYESSATLTTDRLHYKLQIRPLVREGAASKKAKQFSDKKMEKKNLSWAPKRCLNVSRKATLTSTSTVTDDLIS
jgi:hypothetical protein